jgi:DNA-binding LytR/AlgR family response regulator
MQLAMREWRQLGKWRGLASAVAIGLLLGVTGPFGSQNAYSTGVKYAFWMVNALAGFGAAVAADRLLPPFATGRRTLPRLVAVAAASAVPMTFFVAWTMGVAQPGRAFSPLQLLTLFPFVALVQLLIARAIAPDEPNNSTEIVDQADAAEYPSEILSKLPPALRRDILSMQAEDHYLRVHTRHGSALILMRLADAAAMIDPRLGIRVHRSWWVAKDGVRALETTSGRAIVRLLDDTAVPVSRSYLPAARAAVAD